MRGHSPVKIEDFNGFWDRGGDESVPLDHFSACNNIDYEEGAFRTRDGITPYPNTANNFPDALRVYNYVHAGTESLLILNSSGRIYDTGSPFPSTPILTVAGMVDFAYQNVAGRAYLSPHDGNLGLNGEFVYVYRGDGTAARKAGGAKPTTAPTPVNSATAGNVEAGVHIFGVVFETNSGNLTSIGTGLASVTAPGNKKVDITTVQVSGTSYVVARHIVATKLIDPSLFTGDLTGYQFFFVPGGVINDDSTTTITVNFYDADLLEDASHLLDNYESIPAGAVLSTYHNRLLVAGIYGVATTNPLTDESSKWATCLASAPGEPEAISQVDGLIVAPLDGNPLTNAQEYRDILYLFKSTRTYAYTDNGDVPSSWPVTIIDQGIGASIHGVAAVLNSGGVNIEYLIVVDYSGIMVFNGTYQRPEMSYKIKDYWLALDRTQFFIIQIMNDTISQKLFVVLPNGKILLGNYANGFNPKDIKWALWSFDINPKSIALVNTNQLIIAAAQVLP